MKKIDIIQARSDLGVHVDGADIGPINICENLDREKVNNIYVVNKNCDTKEKDKNNLKKNLSTVNLFNKELYEKVSNILKQDNIPLTIGGDHSIVIASALASIKKYKKMGIIWVDAHGDFNTFKTTLTGNIHGLPLAVITGYEKMLLSEFHEGNYYPYQNTVIIGARDLDDLEIKNLKDANITVFTTEDIKKYGAANITKKAINIASKDTLGIHISYDIDVIDPIIAPGVSIPAKNGINIDEAYEILNTLLEVDNVKSIDVVEYNPIKDIDNKTYKITYNIVNKIIDKINKM